MTSASSRSTGTTPDLPAPGRSPLPRIPELQRYFAELRRHLDHLRRLRPRVTGAAALQEDLSLHNDVRFSLLVISQLVIDIAGELSARRGLRFEDYKQSITNLTSFPEIPPEVIAALQPLPGFRNVLVHEYVVLDLERAVAALETLDAIERFVAAVREIETAPQG